MTELPVLIRAREMSCQAVFRGAALEAGIMSGHCDHGTIVTDFLEAAELDLLKLHEENIPDD